MELSLGLILARVFRLGMVVVYFYLFYYFYKGYKDTKAKGFRNNYFVGFSILFAILTVFHLLYGGYELYVTLSTNPLDLKGQFPWYTPTDDAFIKEIANQIKPAYIIFYFLMTCVIAAQVYPLEQAMEWKKAPWSKMMVILGSTLWLLFIPVLSYTRFSIIPIVLSFLAIAIGFFLNIGVNIKLAIASTGDIRKRAVYAMLAFLFLGVGMVWSMESGWGVIFNLSNRDDVVFGSVLQIIGALFYRLGFKTESESTHIMDTIKDIVVGKFKERDIKIYLFFMLAPAVYLIILALAIYPPENNYSFMNDTFSFLGSSDADNNPRGYFLFNIAMIWIGLFMIPTNFHRYRKMSQINKFGAAFCLLLFMIAAIGIMGVGMFPDNDGVSFYSDLKAGRIHNTVALLAFVGLGVGILFDFFLFVKDQNPKFHGSKIFALKGWLPPYVYFFALVGIVAFTQLYWDYICSSHCWPGDGIYSFPMWEWIVIISIFLIISWLLIYLAKSDEKAK